MFRYTTTSISFFILLFALIVQVQYEGSPWWIILVPVILYLFFLVIGSLKISYNFYFPSLCTGKTDENIIAITFDDGPDKQVTRHLLNVLKKGNYPATFFCIGEKAVEHPDIIQKINDDGHLIGNHSYTHHRWFDLFSVKKMTTEIEKTNKAVENIIEKSPILFRPPYGVTNPTLKKAIAKTEMISIGWSLRSFDTFNDKEKVMKKLTSKTKPGDVVLFHDTDEKIIEILEDYLDWLKSNGFEIVSLDQLFKIDAYETK